MRLDGSSIGFAVPVDRCQCVRTRLDRCARPGLAQRVSGAPALLADAMQPDELLADEERSTGSDAGFQGTHKRADFAVSESYAGMIPVLHRRFDRFVELNASSGRSRRVELTCRRAWSGSASIRSCATSRLTQCIFLNRNREPSIARDTSHDWHRGVQILRCPMIRRDCL